MKTAINRTTFFASAMILAAVLSLCFAAGPGSSERPDRTSPAIGSVAVTPSDTVNVFGSGDTRVTRGLYVGTTGDIKLTMADGSVIVHHSVPVGEWPWSVLRVWSTGTTASNIDADY